MLTDLVRAFGMFSDAAVRRTFLLALGVTVLLIAAMFPASTALIEAAGSTGYVALDRLLDVLGLAGTAVLAWFLYPTIVAAVLGFLLDAVVDATERRYFPALPEGKGQSLGESLLYSIAFAIPVLLLNLLALPLYLVPGLNVPVYLALNSYLLGREYVELVLLRRHRSKALPALRQRYRAQLWLSGFVTALLLLVPVVNLLAPIVGSAFATLRLQRAGAATLARAELA